MTSANPTYPSGYFPKTEKLTGKKEISELFEKGSFFYLKPFKIYFQMEKGTASMMPRVLVAVPKSKFSKAFQRNKIKRRVREVYRLNKSDLVSRLSSSGINLKKIGFVYVEDELFSFAYLMDQMVKIPSFILKGVKK